MKKIFLTAIILLTLPLSVTAAETVSRTIRQVDSELVLITVQKLACTIIDDMKRVKTYPESRVVAKNLGIQAQKDLRGFYPDKTKDIGNQVEALALNGVFSQDQLVERLRRIIANASSNEEYEKNLHSLDPFTIKN